MKQCLDEKILSKEEQNRLVEENINLVRHIVFEKFNIPYYDADDAISDGAFGLLKAAATFDPSKGIKFSTYAGKCITNEILMAMRRDKKHKYVVSLDEPLHVDDDGNELTFLDSFHEKGTNPFEKMELRGQIEYTLNILLNCFTGKTRIAFLYFLSGMNQNDIADKLGISQSYVSRIIKKVQNNLKSYTDKNISFEKNEEVFQMTMPNERFYQVNFSSKDISKFNKIFARLLENSNDPQNMPTFQLICNNSRVQIRLEADEKSFGFLAQIIQEIDNFKLSFVSKADEDPMEEEEREEEGADTEPAKENLQSDNVNQEESEAEQASDSEPESKPEVDKEEVFDKSKQEEEGQVQTDTSTHTSSNVNSSINLGREGTITKGILTFISSQETFKVADLSKEFPNSKSQMIQYVLGKAKKANLITTISRGTYKVNHS